MILELFTQTLSNILKPAREGSLADSPLFQSSTTFRVDEPSVTSYWRRVAKSNFGVHGYYAAQYTNLGWAPTRRRRQMTSVDVGQIKGRPFAIIPSSEDFTLL